MEQVFQPGKKIGVEGDVFIYVNSRSVYYNPPKIHILIKSFVGKTLLQLPTLELHVIIHPADKPSSPHLSS